jgi:hypothetical protein
MRRVISIIILFSGLVCLSGCQTLKNTGTGICLIGKGIGDDVYGAYKAVDRADKKFQEKYW